MKDSARFIPARDIAREFAAILEPQLRLALPNMPLTLALIGPGSDVLGYDTARSMDHDWGPRLTIAVPDDLVADTGRAFNQHLDQILPTSVAGFPTRYSSHADGTTLANAQGNEHRVQITSVNRLLLSTVLIDSLDHMTDAVWLSTPMQVLLELTAGEIFVDDSGELTELRRQLGFYPDHVWRYQLAALWMRVSQINPFIGRTGEVDDNVGSSVITASTARDLMRIAILQSRQYAPYSKWLGSAVSRTLVGEEVQFHLQRGFLSNSLPEREAGINAAGILLVNQLNHLRLICPVDPQPIQFHSRPWWIIPAEQVAHALHKSLQGTEAEHWPAYVGGIDAITDSTDALKNAGFRRVFRSLVSDS